MVLADLIGPETEQEFVVPLDKTFSKAMHLVTLHSTQISKEKHLVTLDKTEISKEKHLVTLDKREISKKHIFFQVNIPWEYSKA
jgi:hypothetical protein